MHTWECQDNFQEGSFCFPWKQGLNSGCEICSTGVLTAEPSVLLASQFGQLIDRIPSQMWWFIQNNSRTQEDGGGVQIQGEAGLQSMF